MQTKQDRLLFISDFESYGKSSIGISYWLTLKGPVIICVALFSAFHYYLTFCLFLRQRMLTFSQCLFPTLPLKVYPSSGKLYQNTFLIKESSLPKRNLVDISYSFININSNVTSCVKCASLFLGNLYFLPQCTHSL